MIDMQAARGMLIEESRELLDAMDTALLELEQGGRDSEHINAVFRAAHTIKGSAGLFGLDLIVGFTHVMESLLVRVRNGEVALEPDLLSLIFDCGAYIRSLIEALAESEVLADPDPVLRTALLAGLNSYLGERASAPAAAQALAPAQGGVYRWHLSLAFYPDVLRDGMDPLSLIQYLGRLGEILSVRTDTSQLPSLADMDPECGYLRFEVELESAASREEIAASFDFVMEGSDIRIEQLAAVAPEPLVPVVAELAAGDLDETDQVPSPDRRISTRQTMVKVEARKLDELIDTVGELVIAAASGRMFVSKKQFDVVQEVMGEIEKLVEHIRNKSLNLRMTPIGDIFQRFPRIVRDVAKDLGKKIDLQISGADAELDKLMIDKLADPLLHVVRNAIDHGIEPVEARLAAGKAATGTLRLHAYQDAGSIVIEVSDDGRGLDQARIRAKAVEQGIITADAVMDEQAVFALIFHPGFSTAEKVSDLSGRGVGMDVVRRNIEQLRGEIEIESTLGQGAVFRIRLPLTLAIIDCFQVAVGGSNFAIPLELVVECIDLEEPLDDYNIVNLRGEPLSCITLSDIFSIPAQPTGVRCMVVVQSGRRRAGILVDRLVGELQAVIKPLGYLLQGVRGLGGATILGDGKVALILDVPALLNLTSQQEAGKVRQTERGGESISISIQS
ncbi:chemotaxis protein CheA [Uliginosibacterium flavum]|uniref:Chemotaxis protein CheA n=1 Tax=Uliginosibacterium flavum TaxID=1396831 RepID=A0ABV2TK41_9RHOO